MERILNSNQKGLHFDVVSNPEFLAEGTAMTSSLEDLLKVLQWAADHGYTVRVQPTRRYQREGSDEDILDMSPGEAHTW